MRPTATSSAEPVGFKATRLLRTHRAAVGSDILLPLTAVIVNSSIAFYTHFTRRTSVCQQAVTVNLKDGLHLRPQSQITRLAQKFDCEVHIRKDDRTVDAKSMFDLMTLEAACGTTLYLEASGEGAVEAVRQLARLFESNFQDDDDEDS